METNALAASESAKAPNLAEIQRKDHFTGTVI
jgi:hypothetical protein